MSAEKSLPPWARAPKQSGRIFIEIKNSQSGKTRICIDKKPGYLIGRSRKDCEIFCDSKFCSRVHACLAHDKEGRLHLADLDSVHGTFVNGEELEAGTRVEIVPGRTEIRLGSSDWVISVVKDPADTQQTALTREEIPEQRRRETCSGSQDHFQKPLGAGERRKDERHEGQVKSWHDRDRHTRKHIDGHRGRERDKDRGREKDRERDNHGHVRRRHSAEDMSPKKDHKRSRDTHPPGRSNFHSRAPAEAEALRPLPSSGLSGLAQKRKLLWGNRGGTESAEEGGGAFGVNRWDAATFDNDLDRQKFNKLMGVKSEGNQPVEQSMQADDERGVLSADQQARVLTDVETHFMQGLRRADGRKVGLGL